MVNINRFSFPVYISTQGNAKCWSWLSLWPKDLGNAHGNMRVIGFPHRNPTTSRLYMAGIQVLCLNFPALSRHCLFNRYTLFIVSMRETDKLAVLLVFLYILARLRAPMEQTRTIPLKRLLLYNLPKNSNCKSFIQSHNLLVLAWILILNIEFKARRTSCCLTQFEPIIDQYYGWVKDIIPYGSNVGLFSLNRGSKYPVICLVSMKTIHPHQN